MKGKRRKDVGYKIFSEKEKIDIIKDYVKSGKPIDRIAKQYGCNKATLASWIKRIRKGQPLTKPKGTLTSEQRQSLHKKLDNYKFTEEK